METVSGKMASSSSAGLADSYEADTDDVLLASLPTDTAAAIDSLFARCPPHLRPLSLPVALMSCVYAVVDDRTTADREVDDRRLRHELRLLTLPSSDQRLVLRAEAYEGALQKAACALTGADQRALLAAARALPCCTGDSVRREELSSALRDADADFVADALLRHGWLATAPGAPGNEWLWALPEMGKLTRALHPARHIVLRALARQRHGRAMRHVVERATAKLLKGSPLTLDFALKDLVGACLVESASTVTGVILTLTDAGKRAARTAAPDISSRSRKRARSDRPE